MYTLKCALGVNTKNTFFRINRVVRFFCCSYILRTVYNEYTLIVKDIIRNEKFIMKLDI